MLIRVCIEHFQGGGGGEQSGREREKGGRGVLGGASRAGTRRKELKLGLRSSATPRRNSKNSESAVRNRQSQAVREEKQGNAPAAGSTSRSSSTSSSTLTLNLNYSPPPHRSFLTFASRQNEGETPYSSSTLLSYQWTSTLASSRRSTRQLRSSRSSLCSAPREEGRRRIGR